MNKYNTYTFFWNGPFSQWTPSIFNIDGKTFTCAEQYMMYKKALTFNDPETSNKIMSTSIPKEQKHLGRMISNFDVDTWSAVARDIVFRGSIAKFGQNDELFTVLMKTSGTLLVEASPYDRIWGIGLSEADAVNLPPEQWKGKNWLGQVLTEVREVFEAAPIGWARNFHAIAPG